MVIFTRTGLFSGQEKMNSVACSPELAPFGRRTAMKLRVYSVHRGI
jgi:hypothetical protein